MGYHTRQIAKGKLGEFSKIVEEIEELRDGVAQKCAMLCLCELCDLIGAIEAYLLANGYPFSDIPLREAVNMGNDGFIEIQATFDILSSKYAASHNQTPPVFSDLLAAESTQALKPADFAEIVAAIETLAAEYNLGLNDLIQMKDLTKSAFLEGKR